MCEVLGTPRVPVHLQLGAALTPAFPFLVALLYSGELIGKRHLEWAWHQIMHGQHYLHLGVEMVTGVLFCTSPGTSCDHFAWFLPS